MTTPRVSTQLRQAIKAHRGSAAMLARKARVPGSAISRFASGKGLTVDTLDRLAAALGLGLGPVAGGPYPVPRAPKRRRRPVKTPAARQLRQVEAQGPAVERLGIYWRGGRPFLHLRVKGRAVALEQHSTSPAYLAAGLVYVGLADLPQLVYHGPTGDVPLRGFTSDPAAARFYREFMAYGADPSKWPPESERGVEVMEVKPRRPGLDEPDDDDGEE